MGIDRQLKKNTGKRVGEHEEIWRYAVSQCLPAYECKCQKLSQSQSCCTAVWRMSWDMLKKLWQK